MPGVGNQLAPRGGGWGGHEQVAMGDVLGQKREDVGAHDDIRVDRGDGFQHEAHLIGAPELQLASRWLVFLSEQRQEALVSGEQPVLKVGASEVDVDRCARFGTDEVDHAREKPGADRVGVGGGIDDDGPKYLAVRMEIKSHDGLLIRVGGQGVVTDEVDGGG